MANINPTITIIKNTDGTFTMTKVYESILTEVDITKQKLDIDNYIYNLNQQLNRINNDLQTKLEEKQQIEDAIKIAN